MSSAPDYAEAIIGWRVWRIVERNGGVRLWSVLHDVAWEPRIPLRARCISDAAHDAPAAECACGVYASRSEPAAAPYLVGRNDPGVVQRAFGTVALWGHAYEGVDGWRAELAYPAHIWLRPSPRAHELAERLVDYGARVDVLD